MLEIIAGILIGGVLLFTIDIWLPAMMRLAMYILGFGAFAFLLLLISVYAEK